MYSELSIQNNLRKSLAPNPQLTLPTPNHHAPNGHSIPPSGQTRLRNDRMNPEICGYKIKGKILHVDQDTKELNWGFSGVGEKRPNVGWGKIFPPSFQLQETLY